MTGLMVLMALKIVTVEAVMLIGRDKVDCHMFWVLTA
jgi:hypothetical protein